MAEVVLREVRNRLSLVGRSRSGGHFLSASLCVAFVLLVSEGSELPLFTELPRRVVFSETRGLPSIGRQEAPPPREAPLQTLRALLAS